MIEMNCPSCGHQLRIDDKYQGQRGACAKCKAPIDVPKFSQPNTPPPLPRNMGSPFSMQDIPAPPIAENTPKPHPAKTVNTTAFGTFLAGCGLVSLAGFTLLIFAAIISASGGSTGLRETQSRYAENSNRKIARETARIIPLKKGATLSAFNQLQNGMSYAEACRIIGSEGTVMSSSHIDGIPNVMPPTDTIMYTWEGAGGWGSNMNAMFQNDRLITKAQLGLQ